MSEDIQFLISIQDLEQPEFDNACLERENKRLTKEIERLNNIINKAIEYIDKHKHLSMFADCREPEEWIYDLEITANELLNILRGE